MSGFWQMVVFDVAGTLAIVAVLLTAPDGPRLPKWGKASIEFRWADEVESYVIDDSVGR